MLCHHWSVSVVMCSGTSRQPRLPKTSSSWWTSAAAWRDWRWPSPNTPSTPSWTRWERTTSSTSSPWENTQTHTNMFQQANTVLHSCVHVHVVRLSFCVSVHLWLFSSLIDWLFGPNLNIVTNTIKSFKHSKEKQQIFTFVYKNLKDSSSNCSCQSNVVKWNKSSVWASTYLHSSTTLHALVVL